MSDIRVGSTVMVRGEWGKAEPVAVVISKIWARDPMHSRADGNGSHCIDYAFEDGTRWAYLNQIDSVVQY